MEPIPVWVAAAAAPPTESKGFGLLSTGLMGKCCQWGHGICLGGWMGNGILTALQLDLALDKNI